MNTFLVLVGLAILLVAIAFAGLAVKTFFSKNSTILTSCNGGGESCGCQVSEPCSESDKVIGVNGQR